MALSDAQPSWSGADLRSLPLPDNGCLDAALRAADLPSLLMTYVHLSRDEVMLERFTPHIHSLNTGKQTDIPDKLAETLRDCMRRTLTEPNRAQTGTPEPRLLQKIMTAGMGEPVSEEFIPLLLEQTGLGPQADRSNRAARAPIAEDFKVLIIGAGLSGLGAAIKLGEVGYNYEVIEKQSEVGGTWWKARYPGVGVDTPSHFYSFSFEQNPDWTTYTPKGPEMRDYLIRISHKHGLREHIRFETAVNSMRWVEEDRIWEVAIRDSDGIDSIVRANAIINAHGKLDRWSWPKIEGLSDFKGPMMHTAQWDPEVELRGKRVALIGTGASAAQCGPAIVDEVEHLTVFMRSGHWVVPNALSGASVSDAKRWALRNIPYYMEWHRFGIYWNASDGLYVNLVKDPEWPKDSHSVSRTNELLREYCVSNLERKLKGRADLVAKLTPDCPVFSKRIVMDTNWIDMFMRDNVTLETEGIERVLPDGIRTHAGEDHTLDAIIFATGYDTAKMTGSLDIIGRDGRNLREEWGEEDPVGYYGLMVPGYPNYFHILGPNSAPNHGAGVNLVSETQIHYIVECLDRLMETGTDALEPTEEANRTFNDRVQEQMQHMIWTHPKANSYYRNSKGRVIGSWPFRLVDYWTETRGPKMADFLLHARNRVEKAA